MTRHQLTRAPNKNILEIALQLYNEIITQSSVQFDSCAVIRSDKREFLKNFKIIRDNRRTAFPGIKFSDPYWDIILNAAIDSENGNETSIKAACLSSGVSATATLRCLEKLVSIGIIQRTADPFDRRRFFIRLTEQSKRSLDAWLSSSLFTVGLINTSEMGLNRVDIGSSNHDF